MDDDERESNGFSDNDEVMEGVDELEPEADPEIEPEEEDDGEDDDEGDQEQHGQLQIGPGGDDAKEPSANAAANGTAVDPPDAVQGLASVTSPHSSRLDLRVRPEALNATIYDIAPTIAAPQATSINALAVTPDLRYWMTGGSDGYIRKYDGPGTINGKQLLTVAQRHPFVDSVVKAGILMSYWENEEPPTASGRGAEDHIISPVYSLAIHSNALWLLAGTEGGSINLQSVRHDEGKRITSLQGHSNAVSMLQLAPDEKSVLSGSWDKKILDWDLNTGQVKRQYDGSGGQISVIELRPANGAPIPPQAVDDNHAEDDEDGTMFSTNAKPLPNGVSSGGTGGGFSASNDALGVGVSGALNGDDSIPDNESLFGSPGGSLFGGSDAMGANPFGDDDMGMAPGSAAMEDEVSGFSQDVNLALGGGATSNDMFAPAGDHDSEGSKNKPPEDLDPGVDVEMMNASASVGDESTGISQQRQDQLQQDQELQKLAEDQLLETDRRQSGSAAVPESVQAKANTGSSLTYSSQPAPTPFDPTQVSENNFLSASIDGTIRIWDRRQSLPVARIGNRPSVPPWCMGACWSPDGNRIYAGRRNGVVEEFDIHKSKVGWQPERAIRFPAGSGPVSAVRAMPNGRHLICASHDILRLYDLHHTPSSKQSNTPFLIVPGPPRAGVISHLYIDQTSRFMISTAGTRGWEGTNTETLVGYEITSITK